MSTPTDLPGAVVARGRPRAADPLRPREPVRAANIRDVARRAGVSHQTVSRVINGHPSLRTETRARVLTAMEELNFRPNRAARALVTSRTTTIGVLVSKGFEYGPAASLQAIDSAARAAGYAVDIAHLDTMDACLIRAALDRLLAHGVDGLIILAPQAQTLREIERLSITLPFVTVHSSREQDDHRLSVDQAGGAALATRHLLELGHRRIVHVAGPGNWLETAARARGYLSEMQAWGQEPEVLGSGNWTAESGYRAGRLMLEDPGITAVFSSNDQTALGVMHAFHEAGRRIPEDLSVVGFDDVPEAAHFWPPLTTVRQDFPELGRRCVATLLELMGTGTGGGPSAAGTVPSRHSRVLREVTPDLIIRGSSAPAPGPAAEFPPEERRD